MRFLPRCCYYCLHTIMSWVWGWVKDTWENLTFCRCFGVGLNGSRAVFVGAVIPLLSPENSWKSLFVAKQRLLAARPVNCNTEKIYLQPYTLKSTCGLSITYVKLKKKTKTKNLYVIHRYNKTLIRSRHQRATPLVTYVLLGCCWFCCVHYKLQEWIKNWRRITWKCVFRRWRTRSTAREETGVENL